MKHALIAASLVLVAGVGAGCGGGDEKSGDAAPAAATTADFCESYNSLFDAFSNGKQPTDQEAVLAIKKWADELDQVGTPKDIPADAQDGYELIVSTVQKIKDDATQADVQKLTDAFSETEQKSSDAFGEWATKTCPLAKPSDSPSEGSSSSAP